MKIIHLAPYCEDVGNGVVNVAVDLACFQASAGHTVGFASLGGNLVPLLEKYNVSYFAINFAARNPKTITETLVSLRSVIKHVQPDIVHAHMVPGALFGKALRLGAQFRLVTTVHNAPKRQAVLMGVADRVIVVSSANFDLMKSRGISGRKMRTIKNGPLGSPRRLSTDRAAVHLCRPAVVTIARLFAQKGIADLIAAFELMSDRVADATLYIVGEGPERQTFEQMAARARCSDRIHFVGFVSDPRTYLEQADVFVLASHADPFPLVIPEAREAGCAIVATNVDGIPEGLNGGNAGILVPPSDPRALANALTRLLQDPEELSRWRSRAVQDIEWLRMERVTRETLEVYREVLS
jgi:glycosyltransferase involved in cell wall biosynthesis